MTLPSRSSRAQPALSSRNGHATSYVDDRPPPHNPELERALLGVLLRDPSLMQKVLAYVGTEGSAFWSETFSIIFQVMVALHQKGKPWDIVVLADELNVHPGFKLKDALTTLDEIRGSVPSAICWEEYAARVKDFARRRELILIARALEVDAYSNDRTANEMLDRVKNEIGKIEAPATESQGFFASLSDEQMGMRLASTIKSKRQEWLMPDRIPSLDYSLIAGEGKQGKSQLSFAMGALISTGGEWWDGSGQVEPGHVLFLSAEDDAERVIKPRLEALGANLDMITILEARYRRPSKDGKETFIDTEAELSSLEYWKDVFRRRESPRVMFIDPLPAYIGRNVNDRSNNEVRAVLRPFVHLASKYAITTIGITHLGKSIDPTKPLTNRILDSIAYSNLARSVHFVAKDPANPERKLFLPGVANYSAPGMGALAFTLEEREVTLEDGSTTVVAIAEFQEDTVDVDAQEVVSVVAKKRPGPPSKIRRQMAEWLWACLKDGVPVPAGYCYDSAAEAFAEMRPNPMGVRKEDGLWSKGFTLTRAADIDLPDLPYPMNGKVVNKYFDSTQGPKGRWYWQLIEARPAAGQGDPPF